MRCGGFTFINATNRSRGMLIFTCLISNDGISFLDVE